MKKTYLFAIVMVFSLLTIKGQEAVDVEPNKSEISTNLLDLVVAGTLNVNYERLFNKNQSLYLGVNFFDTYAYYDVGEIDSSSAITLKVAYFIYFSKEKDHSGFFFYPQLKLRTGEVTIDDYFYYGDDVSVDENFSYDVSGVSAGFGLGHKWMFSNKFTLTLNSDIARNLGNFDTDYLSDIELRFGVNFGYRF